MSLKRIGRAGIWRITVFAVLVLAGLALAPGLVATVQAATFGKVVSIGGQAADIALDEARGVLYIANFTANRIDVMSLSDNAVHSSINVPPQPGSLALSPDGQYLVVAHFANFVAPGTPANAVSVIALTAGKTVQTYAMTDPPLGVAFGADNVALLVTTTQFLLFHPESGQSDVLDTVSNVTANTLPVPPAKFPPQIIAASMNMSANGYSIYGLTDTIRFYYDSLNKQIQSLGYTASPPLGPRVVSVSRDGSYYTAGWGLFDASGLLVAQFDNPAGTLNVGSHAIDSSAGLIYAQIPEGTAQSQAAPPLIPTTPSAPQSSVAPPILTIVDADNLAVREKLQLAENLAGKSLLNAKGDMLYAISDSGVTAFPVGHLSDWNRITASQPDLVFRGDFCNRSVASQKITILNPGGGPTDFSLSTTTPGITISPASGTTPSVVTVTVDPVYFQDQMGTTAASIDIKSASAVNVITPIRVLVNNREPQQRGTFVAVPGMLTDVTADPKRRRFYMLRQDLNQVLVFDSNTNTQIAILRTSNTPTSLAITMDRKYLLIGHDNSQLAYVYDLDTLKRSAPIVFPSGHYPRSIAVSSNAILAATRVAGPIHVIDHVDFNNRIATQYPTLGVFENNINIDTVLTSTPNGASIMGASADGTLLLYDAKADTFVTTRKDFTSLSGAYAASNYGEFLVDNNLLDSSLVVTKKLDVSAGSSSGFSFVDKNGFRTTAASKTTPPGVIQRVATAGDGINPTRIVEAPLTFNARSAFTRTLAPLSDRSAIISLTTSGFTVLPWNYDAAVAPPVMSQVVNGADFTAPIAPGGLISIFGSQMSQVSQATGEVPVPTTLGESCLTIDGNPIPLMYVSSGQINAQLPFALANDAALVLHTTGGISPGLALNVQATAPSVFRNGTAGPQTGIASIVRAKNNQLVTLSNPVHGSDELIIYATGLGQVEPDVKEGLPGPVDPLAIVITPPIIKLGGTELPVHYAGLAPGMVGVYQINVGVPFKIATGMSVPLTIEQGGFTTTLSVRVVK